MLVRTFIDTLLNNAIKSGDKDNIKNLLLGLNIEDSLVYKRHLII